MFALAINGSPRKNGNTTILLNTVLEQLTEKDWETELVQLGGQPISGCKACFGCFAKKNQKCVINNDIFNEIMAKMVKADAIILGSPTYFADVTAEMKALLDRSGLVAIGNDGLFAGKIGAGVVSVRRGGAIHVLDTINHMFLISQMLVPGSTYWNMGYGLNPGEVSNDQEGLYNMKHLGQVIDWLAKSVKPNMQNYPKVGAFYA